MGSRVLLRLRGCIVSVIVVNNVREDLLAIIVLTGGNTMFEGFQQRMQAEISGSTQSYFTSRCAVVNSNPERAISAWIHIASYHIISYHFTSHHCICGSVLLDIMRTIGCSGCTHDDGSPCINHCVYWVDSRMILIIRCCNASCGHVCPMNITNNLSQRSCLALVNV